MRKHAALVGLALLLVAVAVSGCGSTAPRAQANDIAVSNTHTNVAALAPIGVEHIGVEPTLVPAAHTSTDGATLIQTSLNSEDHPVARLSSDSIATATPPATVAPTATTAPTQTPEPTATTAPTATPEPTATTPPTTAPTATKAPTATTAPTQAPTQAPAPQAPAATGPLTPDRLVIPSIHLDAKIVTVGWHPEKQPDGSTELVWDVAKYAVGWHKTSAHPGETGNMVFAGHSDIQGEVFRDLGDVQLGQQITVWAAGHAFHYTVDQKFVVPEKYASFEQRLQNGTWIGSFPDERLTLFTCWPPNNNTHRIFVIAHPSKDQ